MRMLLLAALFVCGTAAAQPYPSRTVRIIVPATPGGAIDLIARTLAEKMTASLGVGPHRQGGRHPAGMKSRYR